MRLRRDGHSFAALITASPIRDAAGTPVALSIIVRAIADWKRTEEALRQTTQQLRIVTESMAVPVTRCSRDLKYVWVSLPYADWLGRPAGEIVGRPIVDIIGQRAFAQPRQP